MSQRRKIAIAYAFAVPVVLVVVLFLHAALLGVSSSASGMAQAAKVMQETDAALSLLTEAIVLAPARPACYNNRAQVHRLKGNVADAMEDLNKAIELGGGKGRSACQAFCQRGTLPAAEPRPSTCSYCPSHTQDCCTGATAATTRPRRT